MRKPNYNVIIPSVFLTLYTITSLVSTIHSIELFKLTNSNWLAITLAIAFEIGAAASLLAIATKNKTNQTLVWFLFGLVTIVQIMGNMYHGYNHVENFSVWSEAFWLEEMEIKDQKRIIAVALGAILPLVALGFIKSLVDYITVDDSGEVGFERLEERVNLLLERGVSDSRDFSRAEKLMKDLEEFDTTSSEDLSNALWDAMKQIKPSLGYIDMEEDYEDGLEDEIEEDYEEELEEDVIEKQQEENQLFNEKDLEEPKKIEEDFGFEDYLKTPQGEEWIKELPEITEEFQNESEVTDHNKFIENLDDLPEVKRETPKTNPILGRSMKETRLNRPSDYKSPF